ncbi:hypothetical protein [Anaeromicropila populeti]|uniref:Uncharacterized protein n=1 Tax=Anaeromicropila populeti TaxID=37658 RepID=A0A1I6K8R6_9FIRM|nr:hypothetical protein [Anaeromicropila populeti]SFR87260.1 hypothetical protein SAMN05661086_02260 [Anaeromicropila populeti]
MKKKNVEGAAWINVAAVILLVSMTVISFFVIGKVTEKYGTHNSNYVVMNQDVEQTIELDNNNDMEYAISAYTKIEDTSDGSRNDSTSVNGD